MLSGIHNVMYFIHVKINPTGPAGKTAGSAKPFERLSNNQLQQELRSREEYNFGSTKPQLIQNLKATLRGAQHLPSLLLLNPSQSLSEMNLEHYTILDCEPLHDLKGHIQNVFDELPGKLNKALAGEVKALLDTDLGKDMKTGGDYRLTAIHLLTLLRKRTVQPDILLLLQTLVEISELLYADDSKRTARTILRLYNLTWLHFHSVTSKNVWHLPPCTNTTCSSSI